MNKLKFFLSQNIHMIWREIEHAKECKCNLIVQLSGTEEIPVVMQYGKEMDFRSDYNSQVLINICDFITIHQFAGWVESFGE